MAINGNDHRLLGKEWTDHGVSTWDRRSRLTFGIRHVSGSPADGPRSDQGPVERAPATWESDQKRAAVLLIIAISTSKWSRPQKLSETRDFRGVSRSMLSWWARLLGC